MPLVSPTALRPEDARRYREAGHWAARSLADGFARTCEAHGDRLALIDADFRLSFAELDRLSRQLELGLRSLGVVPGDVVAYQLPNWWEAVVTFLAAARIGAVANPVLPIFRERELRFILRQSGASVLVIPGRFRDCDHRTLIGDLRNRLPQLDHVLVARDEAPPGMQSLAQLVDSSRGSAPQPGDMPTVDPTRVLLLMYTSGTTAAPKGVLHTHETLMAEVRSLERVHRLTPADVTLMPSPLTHISGVIHAILSPALLGTTAVLMERWSPQSGLRLIERERVTYMVGAPTFLQQLADDQCRKGHDVSSLRLFSCGGADVSADLIRRARRELGCIAKRVYGSTEFPTISTTDATDADTMGIETEGRAIWPAEVRIVDDVGCPLPPGGVGEVQARGPECFVGYADAALNADAFTADGWFRTGDLGCLDAAGYLRITGRIKEIVIRKGEKISVRELEDLIAQHPAVAEAAVVALPDANTGERACAVVRLHRGTLTLAELTEFLRCQGLAQQKLPEQILVCAELPRTESGKVHRAALRQQLLSER